MDRPLLTNRESQGIKGIAIMLMLFHHLFAFPDRIPNGLQYSQLITMFAQFGKVCVPIFLFISGYGFYKTKKKSLPHFLLRIKEIYYRYWLVFAIFIPLCVVIGKIDVTPLTIFLNFFAIKTSFNGEWWFITLYILLLLVTPLMYKIPTKLLLVISTSISLIHFVTYRLFSSISLFYYVPDLTPVIAFSIGFIVARHEFQIFSIFQGFVNKFPMFVWQVTFILLILIGVLAGAEYAALLNIICPLFIVFFKVIFNKFSLFSNILMKFGQRSLFMWLTHTFYAYKLFPNFIYFPRYAFLIFLLLLVISYGTAVFLELVFSLLVNRRFVK